MLCINPSCAKRKCFTNRLRNKYGILGANVAAIALVARSVFADVSPISPPGTNYSHTHSLPGYIRSPARGGVQHVAVLGERVALVPCGDRGVPTRGRHRGQCLLRGHRARPDRDDGPFRGRRRLGVPVPALPVRMASLHPDEGVTVASLAFFKGRLCAI